MYQLTRSADGAEENRVMLLKLLESSIGNVFAGLLVGLGAPIIVLEVQLEGLEGIGQGIQNSNTSIDNLWTNSISWNGCDAVGILASGHDIVRFLFEVI